MRVLLHQDRRKALVADDPAQHGQELLDDDRRQPFERLVQQQHARIEDQRAGDGQHLLLAAGQLVAEIVAALGEARKHVVDLGQRPRPRLRHRGHVFFHRQRAEDVALLRHPADAGMRALVRPQAGDVAAVETDAAADVAGDADDRIDQRGLAHAVAAEQRQRLALGEAEADIRQHHGLAIAGRQPRDLQQLRHRPPPRRDRRP